VSFHHNNYSFLDGILIRQRNSDLTRRSSWRQYIAHTMPEYITAKDGLIINETLGEPALAPHQLSRSYHGSY
jgi:hypothetical protein